MCRSIDIGSLQTKWFHNMFRKTKLTRPLWSISFDLLSVASLMQRATKFKRKELHRLKLIWNPNDGLKLASKVKTLEQTSEVAATFLCLRLFTSLKHSREWCRHSKSECKNFKTGSRQLPASIWPLTWWAIFTSVEATCLKPTNDLRQAGQLSRCSAS